MADTKSSSRYSKGHNNPFRFATCFSANWNAGKWYFGHAAPSFAWEHRILILWCLFISGGHFGHWFVIHPLFCFISYMEALSLQYLPPAACSFSFMAASETLLTLEAALSSAQKFNIKLIGAKCKFLQSGFNQEVLLNLHRRLGTCAEKILKHRWDAENVENGWKSKVRLSPLRHFRLLQS